MTHVWWYAARAGGVIAWILLEASVVFGILRSTRLAGRSAKPAWLLQMHQTFSAIAVAFVAIHVGSVVADSYVHFGLADVLVPLASSWRPAAVAWGIVAVWLLAAVYATSLVRDRLPHGLWHGIHLVSYVVWVIATIHVLQAGSDSSTVLIRTIVVAGTGVVALLSVVALSRHAARQPRRRIPV